MTQGPPRLARRALRQLDQVQDRRDLRGVGDGVPTAGFAEVLDLLDPPDLAARKADLERAAAMLARQGGR